MCQYDFFVYFNLHVYFYYIYVYYVRFVYYIYIYIFYGTFLFFLFFIFYLTFCVYIAHGTFLIVIYWADLICFIAEQDSSCNEQHNGILSNSGWSQNGSGTRSWRRKAHRKCQTLFKDNTVPERLQRNKPEELLVSHETSYISGALSGHDRHDAVQSV